MAGVWTSGVILSTFTLAADEDYSITILSDAFADPKPLEGGEVSRDGEASNGIYFLRFGKPA